MTNLKTFFAVVFMATVLMVSCERPVTPEAIKVANEASLTQEVYADKTQGNSGVVITTTGDWTSYIKEAASSKAPSLLRGENAPDWVSINPSSGSAGTYTIVITLAVNTTGENRSALITIVCGDTEITISITQKATTENGTIPETVDVESITLNTATLNMAVGSTQTLTATVLPENATNKIVVWTSSNASVASVNNGVVTANAAGNATITAKAGNKTATCAVTVASLPDGVVINGVKWATRNVDAFGTFAPTPESAGKFYQWNRPTAWASTGSSVTGWDSSYPTGSTWAAGNDPSPAGWRVPTCEEIESLLNTTYVTRKWTTSNGTNGCRFTDKATGNNVFLPAAGYRDLNDGTLGEVGTGGFYWSSTMQYSGYAYTLVFTSGRTDLSNGNNAFGFCVRPVAE